eukprot:6804936-Lingulodinium_polyedra.AAC.1
MEPEMPALLPQLLQETRAVRQAFQSSRRTTQAMSENIAVVDYRQLCQSAVGKGPRWPRGWLGPSP